jgi:hypothetical protein
MAQRITRLSAGLLAIVLALNFAITARAAVVQYLYNFQKTVSPWTAGVACNPEVDDPCDTSAMLQLRVDKKYGSYAALYNQGATALWMRNGFFATGNAISVQFDAFPVENAGRLTPLIYVGYGEPYRLEYFHKIGLPLQKGWQHLEYKMVLPPPPPREPIRFQIAVAIGFLNLDGTKVKQVGGIDNVRIIFYDRASSTPTNY